MIKERLDELKKIANERVSENIYHRNPYMMELITEVERLQKENEKLRDTLNKLAEEHEDQASAWADGGELDHARWHSRLGKIARQALEEKK